MNGIVVVLIGVGILWLVISGRLDCFIKALQACKGADGKTGATPASGTTPTTGATTPQAAKATLDTVLSPSPTI